MPRRATKTKLLRIDEVLTRVLKRKGIPVTFADPGLRDIWIKAVGPSIAAHSQAVSIKRNILFVKVTSPLWMQQLHFLKGEILERLKDLLNGPPLRDIRFSVGNIPTPSKTVPPLTVLPQDLLRERDKNIIAHSLAAIADPELRDIVKRVMIKEITFRRLRERKGL